MTLIRQTLAGLRALLVLTAVCGVAYPLLVTLLAQPLSHQASGSLVVAEGRVVGSTSLGQEAGPQWFQARPSTTGHDGATSGGSNLALTAPELATEVADRRGQLLRDNPGARGPLPADALTASFSGLDPDISPAYAHWQAPRIAAQRHLDVARVDELVEAHTKRPTLGLLGVERVNTVELNQALAGLGH